MRTLVLPRLSASESQALTAIAAGLGELSIPGPGESGTTLLAIMALSPDASRQRSLIRLRFTSSGPALSLFLSFRDAHSITGPLNRSAVTSPSCRRPGVMQRSRRRRSGCVMGFPTLAAGVPQSSAYCPRGRPRWRGATDWSFD